MNWWLGSFDFAASPLLGGLPASLRMTKGGLVELAELGHSLTLV